MWQYSHLAENGMAPLKPDTPIQCGQPSAGACGSPGTIPSSRNLIMKTKLASRHLAEAGAAPWRVGWGDDHHVTPCTHCAVSPSEPLSF